MTTKKTKKVSTPLPDNNPKTQYGIKKPSLGLIPSGALFHESAAFMEGADKYGPYNWRDKPVSTMVYVHAALRHLYQYIDGENFDPISEAHHLGHARACLGIILDAWETGNLIDNRPRTGTANDLIKRFAENATFEDQLKIS
jgi:hypothetical protein